MLTKPRHKFNGLLVRMIRERKGTPVGEFADAAGISVRTLYNIERGFTRNPRLSVMSVLAQVLGVEVHQLIVTLPTPKDPE